MNADCFYFRGRYMKIESVSTQKKLKSEVDLLTEQIIGSAYAVSNALGVGFLEKVYENAMVVELKQRGLKSRTAKCLQGEV